MNGKTLLVDDVAPAGIPSCSKLFVRLLHTAPKRQKVAETPISSLRHDHVAVSVSKVDDLDADTGYAVLASDRNGDPLGVVKLLSLESFLTIGSVRLHDNFASASLDPRTCYSFHGTHLPSFVHTKSGRQLITEMVQADAYPGNSVYHLHESAPDLSAQLLES